MCRGQQKTCRFSATWVASEPLTTLHHAQAFSHLSAPPHRLHTPPTPKTHTHSYSPSKQRARLCLSFGQSGHWLSWYTILLETSGCNKLHSYIQVSRIYDNSQVHYISAFVYSAAEASTASLNVHVYSFCMLFCHCYNEK